MINRFLNKSDEEQTSIVIDILKKDYAHNFSEDRTFKYKDIAKYTLKLMNTYGYFNEDNPLLMSECNEFKICFQPNFKGKKRLDRVIVYFAHMITGDKGDLRVLDIEKARTIDYLMKVLQSPTKMYYQNGRNSFLFERQILLNESHQNCHMVLYIEKIKSNMMRVVTILPNVNKNRTKMQKENNSITEISSFHQLRHFISPSVGEDFGNGGEILTNNDTNIQNNLIECTPEDEIILKLIENQQDNFLKPTEMSQENIEKIEKLEKAINSPATPENIKETMRKALDLLKSGTNDDKKEIDSLIMKIVSVKNQITKYNEDDYNSSYNKLLSFGKEKVMEEIKDFINKNQNDVSLFDGKDKVEAQEFVNRIFELQSELKYDFNKEVASNNNKYNNIKSCLLDDGDDSDDYIYEGKLIHNVEVLPKDTWEIIEFYNYGVVLKHIPTSVLADSKPNKNVSLDELKALFASDKIEIDGIEKGNTKVFNLCIKAIIKCIDSLDMSAYKENLLAELNASKSELEKTIEASNLLASEKSNLEKETSEKIQTLESDIASKSISMEEASRLKDEETARLKKQLEDLEALNSMRTLIDMLQDDIAKKDFKETPSVESNGKIKVKEITIHSSEGRAEGYGFPKTFSSYEDANNALLDVLEDSIAANGYDNSANFTVLFEDGQKYEGTIFISEKRSNPKFGNVIGKHIKSYLDFELSGNRQNEESKKEIREFLEEYDLGL